MNEPRVFVDDVAARLGVAKSSIHRWIEGKGMPAHQVGRLWKLKLTEVASWVRSGGAESKKGKAGA